MRKPKLLINLPEGFFTREELAGAFYRLEALASEVRKTSWNTPEEIVADIKWAEAVIMWSWPELNDEILDQCPSLNFIGHINNSLAMAQAEIRHEITVSEARYGWSSAVAEMALTLILSVLRKVSDYHAAMRLGREAWVNAFPDDIDTSERRLIRRNVGLVGFGQIGQKLASFLKPFEVNLRTYDPYLPKSVATQLGARLTELDEVVRESEVIVLCAANTEEARHLITRAHIEAMRPETVLVNIGRSSLIDMEALIDRLKRGDMYAALDVFDQEPLEPESPLRKLPNVYLTPHRGGGLIESVHDILAMLTDDLQCYLEGKELKHRLTKKSLHCLA